MAADLYDLAREAFLDGDISWSADDIKVALIDEADYTVNLATDEFLSDVAGAAIVGTSGNLASKTVTGGVADAADVTITGVTGDQLEAVLIYKDTGVSSTSRLIAYINTAASGLPLTPNGGNVVIQWDAGSNKIFKL